MLQKLFGPKIDRQKCLSEFQRVHDDVEAVTSARNMVHDTPTANLQWYEKRLALLHNEKFHPVARLAAGDNFEGTISDYALKLKEAAKGDKNAYVSVVETRSKIKTVLDEESERLKNKIEHLEFLMQHTVKWQEKKAQALDDRRISTERLEILIPKDRNDMTQWKTYYVGRVKILENEAIDITARFLWSNRTAFDCSDPCFWRRRRTVILGNPNNRKFIKGGTK